MSDRRLQIGLTGAICDNDLVLAEYLKRLGVECIVFRPVGLPATALTNPLTDALVRAILDILMARSSSCVRSDMLTTYIHFQPFFLPLWLGMYRFLYPFLSAIGWPKFATIGTGSSLTEAIEGCSLRAVLARIAMRWANVNIVNNYPHALKNLICYKIENIVFLPFPFVQVDANSVVEGNAAARYAENRITFFHPSHLDWAATDVSSERNSTKGNDRFIAAFARFANQYEGRVHCTGLPPRPRSASCEEAG